MRIPSRKKRFYSLARFECLFLTLCLLPLVAGCPATRDAFQAPSKGAANLLRTTPQSTGAAPDRAARFHAAYGKLSLHFEANQGQTDPRVRFVARGQGYALSLLPTEAVLALRRPRVQGDRAAEPRRIYRGRILGEKKVRQEEAGTSALRIALVGSNPDPQVTGREELSGKVNYILGNSPGNWHTNVPTFAKIHYREVYPGIDLVFYGNQQQLEYDFVVAPGGDPATIRLAFEGIDSFHLDAQDGLVLHAAGGDVRLRQPLVYQEMDGERHLIAGRYVLMGSHQIGFRIADYDTAKPLIIDPVLTYLSYLGGAGDEWGGWCEVDTAGNVYMVGETTSPNFPTSAGAFQRNYGGGSGDVFIAKINPAGSALVYATYLGGASDELGMLASVDDGGNVQLFGTTASMDFPTTAGALQRTHGGGRDVFISKLNSTGSGLVYSTLLGGNGDEYLTETPYVDSVGNVYLIGATTSPNFPTTPGAAQGAFGGGTCLGTPCSDVFIAKLNPTGTAFVYSTYLGGSGGEDYGTFDVDPAGNVYVVGPTTSPNFPTTPGAFQRTYGGGQDAFIAKLNPTGTAFVYSTYLGGSGEERIGSLVNRDGTGNVYVVGTTTSPNFPTTPGAAQGAFGGGTCYGTPCPDLFIAKLNPTGSALAYSTYLGGSGREYIGSFPYVDPAGNVYVVGTTTSPNFPTTPGAAQGAFGGGTCYGTPCPDLFIAKLNPTGTAFVYSTYLGGSDYEDVFISDPYVDPAGNVYVVGTTTSPNFPTTPGAFQRTYGGGQDAFIAKLNAAGTALIYSTYLGGSGREEFPEASIDFTGNVYVVGTTTSPNFPTTPGAAQGAFGGGTCYGTPCPDLFIAKLNPTGSTLMYSTYLGGSGNESPSYPYVDDNGNVYVVGRTTSPDLLTTPGSFQPVFGGGSSDVFIARIVTGSAGGPSLALNLNKSNFLSRETLILAATVVPGLAPVTADVYVALQLPYGPYGSLLFLQGDGGFTWDVQPIVRNWTISPFTGQIFTYTFSGAEPVGNYSWLAAFTEPGTLNFIGPIVSAPFTFSP